MPISSITKVLISALSLGGITAGGMGAYAMFFKESKIKNHKHQKVFDGLSKSYRSREYKGSNGETVKVEMIDPSDSWWEGKWKEYKGQGSVSPNTKKEIADASLEGFQSVCFEEIQKWGSNFSDTAKYINNSGKIKSSGLPGPVTSNELKERKFSWEMCVRVTVTAKS